MRGYTAGRGGDEDAQIRLHLAREQGDAFGAAVEHEIAALAGGGAEQRAGDLWVGYAAEPAAPMYDWSAGQLVWQEPGEANLYLGVTVRDSGDGRFLPGARVAATLIDADGHQLGPCEHPLVWHPTLYHYGRNWHIAADGLFTLRVHVDPLAIMRHDRLNGGRFTQPVEAEFREVELRVSHD